MKQQTKAAIKQIIGELPLAAEMYYQIRQPGKPLNRGFSLQNLADALPEWCSQTQIARQQQLYPPGDQKRIMLFGVLRYWIEHATLLSMALTGFGHTVWLTYLPYSNLRRPMNRFDIKRQSRYIAHVLKVAKPLFSATNLLDIPRTATNSQLSGEMKEAIEQISIRDVQYSLQIEEFATSGDSDSGQLFSMRKERNTQAALATIAWINQHQPDVILTPNGSILETASVFQAARRMNIPVVTYEFGEQRQRIWLAQNNEVMRQDTSELWEVFKDRSLTEEQLQKVKNLYSSRQQASLWDNFSRRWQDQASQGIEKVRTELNLDQRPIVLLAANVIGDSLTLGRQVFSHSMTEWIERTLTYFASRNHVQLVIRIHPGERYTTGPSVSEIVQKILPTIPSHIHLVTADDPINTYDLVQLASLGLVYTTTVGMEMAMAGVPVMVAGQTHYRNRGFTQDPQSWDDYFACLSKMLESQNHPQLNHDQIQRAWNYAYCFFFIFPLPFPWRLHFFKQYDLQTWPLERVFSPEGREAYGETFKVLTGEPVNWSKISNHWSREKQV